MILRLIAYGIATIVTACFYDPFGQDFERYGFGHTVLLIVVIGIVLDLGSLAGRVFRDEIAWQTYSSLLLLPKSILQISYGKVMGCLTAVFPALAFLLIGMLCSSAEVLLNRADEALYRAKSSQESVVVWQPTVGERQG